MTPTSEERRTAAWVAVLFLLAVVLQRFSVPGLTAIALLVPVVAAWVGLALMRRVVTIDFTRLVWWLAFACVTGALMLVQYRAVSVSVISVKSWALMLVALMPFIVRLVERGVPAYITMLRHITSISTWLGVASIGMMGIQLAGVPYDDWFARFVPSSLQLSGFNYSYPVEYGSQLYKSNAFFGLEPSMVSSLLGVGILAAIVTRAPWWKLMLLAAGVVVTVAGSGMIIVLIGVVVLLLGEGSRPLVYRFTPILLLGALAGVFTEFGRVVFDRVNEFQSDNSSTSVRVFEPYRVLIPDWVPHLSGALLGYGPGSSQRIAEQTPPPGILVTTPAKIFFEYGLVGGVVLGGFVLICYWGGPSRAFSISLVISIWMLQQGLNSMIITLPVLITVTLWSPRVGEPIESSSLAFGMKRKPVDTPAPHAMASSVG